MRYKNNPFNIRYVSTTHWLGQCGSDNGFCQFTNIKYGIRAAAYLLMRSYRKAGVKTYGTIIARFAPPLENNTQAYTSYVCSQLHVFPWDELQSVGAYCGLLHYMWNMEQGSGSAWNASWIRDVIKEFDIRLYERRK